MKRLFLVLFLASLIGFGVSSPTRLYYENKAKMVQRIQKSTSADMFGDDGTPVGKPMKLIIDDPKAFLGGPDSDDVYKVDEGYLSEHKIHPLQLKTVDFITFWTRMLSLLGAFLGMVGLAWIGQKRKKVDATATASDVS